MLYMATMRGDMGAVEDLVPKFDQTLNPRNLSRNLKGETAWSLTAQMDAELDAFELVKHLLQSNFIKYGYWDEHCLTPLHHAVLKARLQVCNLQYVAIIVVND